MPWCPKCKMEYREGITECYDCKIELVDVLPAEIEFVPFIQTADRNTAERLVDYFKYSDLEAVVKFDEENEEYIVSVPSEDQKKAQKYYKAFYTVEQELYGDNKTDSDSQKSNNPDDEDDSTEELLDDTSVSDEDEEYPEDQDTVDHMNEADDDHSGPYVMKSDKYKDLNSSVFLFLFFGIAGLLVVILNLVGVLSFIHGTLQLAVFTALFAFFIYVGISTRISAMKVKAEIETENKLTEEINTWLEQNITKEFKSSFYNDSISPELNYLKLFEKIKELLIEQFGKQNLAYLDHLIEEYYTKTFDEHEI